MSTTARGVGYCEWQHLADLAGWRQGEAFGTGIPGDAVSSCAISIMHSSEMGSGGCHPNTIFSRRMSDCGVAKSNSRCGMAEPASLEKTSCVTLEVEMKPLWREKRAMRYPNSANDCPSHHNECQS
jgi:hypothetical protein